MADLRILKCLNVGWKHPNIINNTEMYKKYRESKRESICGTKYCQADQEVEYEKRMDKFAKCSLFSDRPTKAFRGANLDFFTSQGLLSSKCNKCDTSIKYHIREGNDAYTKVTEDCPIKDIGTATNYLSFSSDYKVCVKYAMTTYTDGRPSAAKIGVLIYMETMDSDDLEWFCPSMSEKWKKYTNYKGENQYDNAYQKKGSVTQDWVNYDKEILLKINNKDKSLSYTDPRIKLMYIRSEKINSVRESKDTLPTNIDDIKYNVKYIFNNPQGDGENKIGKMYLTFHDSLESIYTDLAMGDSPEHIEHSPKWLKPSRVTRKMKYKARLSQRRKEQGKLSKSRNSSRNSSRVSVSRVSASRNSNQLVIPKALRGPVNKSVHNPLLV